MKKIIKIFAILLLVIILIFVGLQLWIYLDHTKAKKKLVVVKSYYESFYAVDEDGELYDVSFDNPRKLNGKDLKRGQEIEIYWHGTINHFSPSGIGGVRKYKILKEKSDIEIPKYAIQHCYSSTRKVMLHVRNFTNTGIEFRILDTNEIPYGYDFCYKIKKKTIQIDNTELNDNENIVEQTVIEKGNTTIIEPFKSNASYEWKETELIGNIEEYDNYTLEVVDSSYGHYDIEGKYDWTELYGALEPGEYKYILTLANQWDRIHFSSICIEFVVDENGNISYEPATFLE